MKAFLVLILSCAFFNCHSQNTKDISAQIDSLVNDRLNAVAPGGVVLVANKGEIIYRKAFGTANRKTKEPMQPENTFRIGSMTKQFTAIAILQLAEQGKINLQDSIQVYAKSFPNKEYPVTIENLLSQTSGIIDFQAIQHPNPDKVHKHYTPQQTIDYFKDEPLRFVPGSRFEYSNSNFELLGYIIEQVTKQPYGDYIEQTLLKQAGLTHTYYISYGKPMPNMTAGYSRFDHKKWEDAELQEPTVLYSAGGLASTVDDIWQWHQALAQGKLISKKLLEKAYSPYKLNNSTLSEYGYGWFMRDIDGLKTIEHGGSTDGYQTDEIYLPEQDVFVVCLFNAFENDMDWQSLSNDIARFAVGHPLQKDVALDEDDLRSMAGTYAASKEHKLVFTFKKGRLYVEATNPKDRLPQLPLYAESPNLFYIKEAAIKFEFVLDRQSNKYKIITYNSKGKDAEWQKEK